MQLFSIINKSYSYILQEHYSQGCLNTWHVIMKLPLNSQYRKYSVVAYNHKLTLNAEYKKYCIVITITVPGRLPEMQSQLLHQNLFQQSGKTVVSKCDRTSNGWSRDVTVRNWACYRAQKKTAVPPKTHTLTSTDQVSTQAISYKE